MAVSGIVWLVVYQMKNGPVMCVGLPSRNAGQEKARDLRRKGYEVAGPRRTLVFA